MNWEQVEGTWKDIAGSAKAHWGKITDDDWMVISGRKEQLAGAVEKRYGITKEQAEAQVETWSSALQDVIEPPKSR
jgi:uncharacterized protein YjbJ (UPF0337 family)